MRSVGTRQPQPHHPVTQNVLRPDHLMPSSPNEALPGTSCSLAGAAQHEQPPELNALFEDSPAIGSEDPTSSLPFDQPPATITPSTMRGTHVIHAETGNRQEIYTVSTSRPLIARPPPVLASFRSTSSVIESEECRGRQHVQQVCQSGEAFIPIADDDWEAEAAESDAEEGSATRDTNVDLHTTDDQHNPTTPTMDPFRYTPTPARPSVISTPTNIHNNRAVAIIYLLVLWLHTQFHLAFRACAAVLVALSLAFAAAGSPIEPPIYTTLPSVISALDAEPTMKTYPVCPQCMKVFPDSVSRDATCDRCSCRLFPPKPATSNKRPRSDAREVPKPHLQFPSKSIEDYLTTILAVPGIEDEMEAWRKKTRTPGRYTDIFDGEVCKTIPGVDGSPFFYPKDNVLEPNELRIGVSLGADW